MESPSTSSSVAKSSQQPTTLSIGNERTWLISPTNNNHDNETVQEQQQRRKNLSNFCLMSVLFASNPCCVLACMALATARLGTIGAWQSGMLYLSYTLSSILGATWVVKRLGAKQSIIIGMIFYCGYVACFLVAAETLTVSTTSNNKNNIHFWKRAGNSLTIVSAVIGGVGGGILWTAQGVYFSQAAERHAAIGNCHSISDCTSYLAGIFAGIYMAMEALLELLPSILIQVGIVDWRTIFGIYTLIACFATLGMQFVEDYPSTDSITPTSATSSTVWAKVLAAWRLLRDDAKMRYLIGFNAAFGFAGAFVHSYVNGEVIRISLRDDQSKFVGALSAWSAIVSSVSSLGVDVWSRRCGKGPVVLVGALSFFGVAFPFLILPDLSQWGWTLLILIYALYGTGRAVFEGTLKAVFAEYFPDEKEGAFANIILQSGLTSTFGFILTYWGFSCPNDNQSYYCVTFHDGSRHFVLWVELSVVVTSVLAFFGYWCAASIFTFEQQKGRLDP